MTRYDTKRYGKDKGPKREERRRAAVLWRPARPLRLRRVAGALLCGGGGGGRSSTPHVNCLLCTLLYTEPHVSVLNCAVLCSTRLRAEAEAEQSSGWRCD